MSKTPETRNKIRDLVLEGLAGADIARRLGITRGAVNSAVFVLRQKGELPKVGETPPPRKAKAPKAAPAAIDRFPTRKPAKAAKAPQHPPILEETHAKFLARRGEIDDLLAGHEELLKERARLDRLIAAIEAGD